MCTAVEDLSMTINRGEMFGLLGPSGSGKSTTLRLILGLESIDHGRISFEGSEIKTIAAEKRGFGIVFQNYALFTDLTAFDNIAYGLRERRQSASQIRSRVEGLLHLMQLPAEIKTCKPHELSGGEQQRVAIARALAIEPPLLLMDEPFANLDAGMRRNAGEAIRTIVKRLSITTVFVTHDQSEAFSLCDRIAVVRNGKVIQTGTPASVYEQPSQPWVAQFLGFQLFAGKRVDSGLGSTCEFAIGDGDWRVRTRNSLGISRTDRATIAIRPEDVHIAAESSNSRLLQPAKVLSVSFGGPTSRITLGIGTTTLEALVLHRSALLPGDQCRIEISLNDPLVYPVA